MERTRSSPCAVAAASAPAHSSSGFSSSQGSPPRALPRGAAHKKGVQASLRSLGALIALLLGACNSPARSPTTPGTTGNLRELTGVVDHVIDGDTLVVNVGNSAEHVRLLGVDTPETTRPGQPVECYGPEASAALKALLPAGTSIRVARDEELRDHFGRALLYVWRADGTFINRELLARGAADLLVIEPNHAHTTELTAARNEARRAGVGLWGSCMRTLAPP